MEAQVQQMLEVVGSGIKKASSQALQSAQNRLSSAEAAERRRQEEAKRRISLLRGTWHDPRLDCVSGIGLISEVGLGDELMRPEDFDETFDSPVLARAEKSALTSNALVQYRKSPPEIQELKTKPIVVIKNFETTHGRDDILGVIAKWAAALVESGVAHVVVLSDNRENAKELARGE